MTIERVLIVGAGGAVGLEAARYAVQRGLSVTATYRTERPGVEEAIRECGARAVQADLRNPGVVKPLLDEADAAIFTPILSTSAPAAELLPEGRPAVFFSSNNVAIDPQADDYARLLEAEDVVRRAAPKARILRPTMIYGYPGDGNLSLLMKKMRRWPLTPMIGSGGALQQPVYYRDLARVAVDILLDDAAAGTTRAVAGPAPVTKKTLYRSVADASGASPAIIIVPAAPGAVICGALERVGLRFGVKAAQFRRADLDKIPLGEKTIFTRTTLAEGLRALAADNLK